MPTPLTLDDIDGFDRATFIARLRGLFEGESTWIPAAAWAARPFASRDDLEQALVAAIREAPPEQQVALIQAHPDLVGRAALSGTLSRASTGEQATAGLEPDQLTADDIAEFTRLNHAYRERFGFPFVICARDSKKASILAGFRQRLHHDREREIATAIEEIGKIVHYRLRDLVAGNGSPGPPAKEGV